MAKIAIIGTTSWGVTLGVVLAKNGNKVRLWARTEQEAKHLNNPKANPEVFQGVKVPSNLIITSKLSEAMDSVKVVILAVPSQTMRQNVRQIVGYIKKSMLVASAAKGLEIESGKRMSQVIADEIDPSFHSNICVVSGPNLSQEVIKGLPAVTVVAAEDEEVAKKIQKLLACPSFCIYTNTDVTGVELGGAFKNIIALGAGMADGMNMGDNAKAAFITRGLTEMSALGVALGAHAITFSGLAGLGDLIATCASPLSRNHFVGVELAKGRALEDILSSMDAVAEGVSTTAAAWKLAKQLGLEMPITEKIYHILYSGVAPEKAAAQLMSIETKHELEGRKWRLFSFLRRQKSKVKS